ncbi:MAG: OmpA family protein [Bacteroidia bacterium]
MRNFILFFFLSIITFTLFSQTPNERFLGGKNFDIGKRLVYLADGSYVIAAEVASADGLGEGHSGDDLSADVVVMKYNPQGVTAWKVLLDGEGHEDLSDMIATSDGGFALIGTTNSKKGTIRSTHGEMDIFVAKISSAGDLKWARNYGGIGNDRGFGLTEVYDGGLILACEAGSLDGNMQSDPRGGLDAWLARVDYTGEIMWEKHYGGSRNETALCALTLGENSYLIAGVTNSEDADVKGKAGQHDAWIFEIDENGKMQWQTKYGGEANEMLHAMRLTPDNQVVMIGTTFSKTGNISKQRGLGDIWLLKIDTKGKLIFSKTYGGTKQDGGSDVLCTKDGGYLLVGMTQSKEGDFTENHGYYDGAVLKTDKNGTVSWTKALGSVKKDFLHTAIEISEGEYLCMGLSDEDKTNPSHLINHNGRFDIWLTNVTEPNKKVRTKTYNPMIEGVITDKKSKKPIKASLGLFDFYDQDSVESVATNPDNGEYMMLAPIDEEVGARVTLAATPLGYLPYTSEINTDSLIKIPVWKVNMRLTPIANGERMVLQGISFDMGKDKFTQESEMGLVVLSLFMKNNPSVKIQLEGRANKEEVDANALSQQRAESVKSYLLKKGIPANRITTKGLGSDKPIEKEDTPVGRAKNRSVELVIIGG